MKKNVLVYELKIKLLTNFNLVRMTGQFNQVLFFLCICVCECMVYSIISRRNINLIFFPLYRIAYRMVGKTVLFFGYIIYQMVFYICLNLCIKAIHKININPFENRNLKKKTFGVEFFFFKHKEISNLFKKENLA